jgi:hypothetical protein
MNSAEILRLLVTLLILSTQKLFVPFFANSQLNAPMAQNKAKMPFITIS